MPDETKYNIFFYGVGVEFAVSVRGRREFWQDIAFIHGLLGYPPPADMDAPVRDNRYGPMYQMTREQHAAYGKFRRNRSRVERGFPPKD